MPGQPAAEGHDMNSNSTASGANGSNDRQQDHGDGKSSSSFISPKQPPKTAMTTANATIISPLPLSPAIDHDDDDDDDNRHHHGIVGAPGSATSTIRSDVATARPRRKSKKLKAIWPPKPVKITTTAMPNHQQRHHRRKSQSQPHATSASSSSSLQLPSDHQPVRTSYLRAQRDLQSILSAAAIATATTSASPTKSLVQARKETFQKAINRTMKFANLKSTIHKKMLRQRQVHQQQQQRQEPAPAITTTSSETIQDGNNNVSASDLECNTAVVAAPTAAAAAATTAAAAAQGDNEISAVATTATTTTLSPAEEQVLGRLPNGFQKRCSMLQTQSSHDTALQKPVRTSSNSSLGSSDVLLPPGIRTVPSSSNQDSQTFISSLAEDDDSSLFFSLSSMGPFFDDFRDLRLPQGQKLPPGSARIYARSSHHGMRTNYRFRYDGPSLLALHEMEDGAMMLVNEDRFNADASIANDNRPPSCPGRPRDRDSSRDQAPGLPTRSSHDAAPGIPGRSRDVIPILDYDSDCSISDDEDYVPPPPPKRKALETRPDVWVTPIQSKSAAATTTTTTTNAESGTNKNDSNDANNEEEPRKWKMKRVWDDDEMDANEEEVFANGPIEFMAKLRDLFGVPQQQHITAGGDFNDVDVDAIDADKNSTEDKNGRDEHDGIDASSGIPQINQVPTTTDANENDDQGPSKPWRVAKLLDVNGQLMPQEDGEEEKEERMDDDDMEQHVVKMATEELPYIEMESDGDDDDSTDGEQQGDPGNTESADGKYDHDHDASKQHAHKDGGGALASFDRPRSWRRLDSAAVTAGAPPVVLEGDEEEEEASDNEGSNSDRKTKTGNHVVENLPSSPPLYQKHQTRAFSRPDTWLSPESKPDVGRRSWKPKSQNDEAILNALQQDMDSVHEESTTGQGIDDGNSCHDSPCDRQATPTASNCREIVSAAGGRTSTSTSNPNNKSPPTIRLAKTYKEKAAAKKSRKKEKSKHVDKATAAKSKTETKAKTKTKKTKTTKKSKERQRKVDNDDTDTGNCNGGDDALNAQSNHSKASSLNSAAMSPCPSEGSQSSSKKKMFTPHLTPEKRPDSQGKIKMWWE